jgi:hypothetical protein
MRDEILAASNRQDLFDQRRIVGAGRSLPRENACIPLGLVPYPSFGSRPIRVTILSAIPRRVFREHQIDVVLNCHHVSRRELRIQTAAGVRDNQQLNSKGVHDVDGQFQSVEPVAFVVVPAAFHDHHWLVAQSPADQTPSVTEGRRTREVGDGFVSDCLFGLDAFRYIAQARAKD